MQQVVYAANAPDSYPVYAMNAQNFATGKAIKCVAEHATDLESHAQPTSKKGAYAQVITYMCVRKYELQPNTSPDRWVNRCP